MMWISNCKVITCIYLKQKNDFDVFKGKILLLKRNLGRNEYNNFPNSTAVFVKEEEILTYCQYLRILHVDFNEWLQDIFKMNIPDSL